MRSPKGDIEHGRERRILKAFTAIHRCRRQRVQVATIQVANTVGAGLGGYVLEAGGVTAPVVSAGVLLALTGLVVLMGVDAGSGPHNGTDTGDASASTDPRIPEPATTKGR